MTEREILTHEITSQCAARYSAFLRLELMRLPTWHRLHAEYAEQLHDLERRAVLGPRRIPAVTV